MVDQQTGSGFKNKEVVNLMSDMGGDGSGEIMTDQESSNGPKNEEVVDLTGNMGDDVSRDRPQDTGGTDTGIDLNAIRLSQDFAGQLGVRKVRTTVPVRKPNRQSFVRTHPDDNYRIQTAVLELKELRETYLVGPDVRDELASEIVPKMLITTIDRQRVVFLWPIALPDASGRHNPWHQSALDAADRAERAWVRVAANMQLGAYEVFEATADLGEPEWPEEPFERLIELAFRDRFIQSMDHPAVRQLRGQV